MKKIAILTSSFQVDGNEYLDSFKRSGYSLIQNPHGRKVSADEIFSLASGAEGIIAGVEDFSAPVLQKLSGLKAISRVGIGIDNIDLKKAESLGIRIFNTPDAVTPAVAELTVGLMLDLMRNISRMDRDVRQGKWKKQMGNMLSGKKIGIVGFGRVGHKVASLLSSFKTEIAYHDTRRDLPENPFVATPFHQLLNWADIVTLHCSADSRSGYLIGEKEIRSMKKGAWLINTSRGGLIDEHALAAALKDEHLRGAALDVFQEEPYHGELASLEQVILTPHIGSYAKETRLQMEREAAQNLLKGLGIFNG